MFKLNCLKKNYSFFPINSLTLIGILFLFVGCNTNKNTDITFFGGKIKNPQGEYVYFSKDEKVIDSAKLNKENRFSFQLDSIKTGLYSFKHGPEFQYLYLEPQDSLLIYLNTWDFDESLIFSGKGSAENNYLISLWLKQEKNEKNFKYNYRLDEAEFSAIVTKGIQGELDNYNQFIEGMEETPSEFFDKLAKAGIYYPYYFIKERYAYNHKRALKLKKLPTLSNDFYNYRSSVDLNDESLLNYWAYTPYLYAYLWNLAYEMNNNDASKNNIALNYMHVVNDKIHLESFKNELLANSMWKSLSDVYLSDKDFNKIKDCFFKDCSDEQIKNELKKSIQQKEKLKKGDTLPLLIASNFKGEKININTIAKNNSTVIYFWPKDLGNAEMLYKKLNVLKKEYPHIVFIGIERNKNNADWNNFIKTKNLSKNNQFKILKSSEYYTWFDGDMARTIIINDKGNIQNGYLFFNNKSFEKHLKKLKSQ